MSPVTEHSAEGQREAAEPGALAPADSLCPADLCMRWRDSILCPGIRAVSGALAFPLRALVTGETRPCPLPRPPPPGLSKGKPVLVQTPHTQEGPHKKTSLIGGGAKPPDLEKLLRGNEEEQARADGTEGLPPDPPPAGLVPSFPALKAVGLEGTGRVQGEGQTYLGRQMCCTPTCPQCKC